MRSNRKRRRPFSSEGQRAGGRIEERRYWLVSEIDRVLRHWDPAEDGIDPALLTHISPIGWDNIMLYGEYALDRSLVARHPRHGQELGVEN